MTQLWEKIKESRYPGLRLLKKIMLNSNEHEIYHALIVKMPTLVGILTFISMINTTSESLKARKAFILQHFKFYDQLKFHAGMV